MPYLLKYLASFCKDGPLQSLHCLIDNHHTTHNHFTGSLDFVWDNSGQPVPEETFTHSHLSW